MKKLFRIFGYVLLTILALLLVFVVFLNVYYGVLGNRLKKSVNATKVDTTILTVPQKAGTAGSTEEKLNLIPVPQKVTFIKGSYSLPQKIVFSVSDSLKVDAGNYLKFTLPAESVYSSAAANFVFTRNEKLPIQGYILKITPDRVTIEYSNRQGMWYALVSLKVLNLNYSGILPCVEIEDSPDLQVRGLMLDISRDKVPTRETLIKIAQILADLKYNHLELYIEGFSFAYPTFKNLWEGKETPVTGEDIEALDVFCKDHLIDLVPNQNSLGHMTQWLATDEYKDLAECPKGFKMMGLITMKGTMDPNDPRTLDLVTKMTDDLLPHFTSNSFNVNLDEPFELGKGKSKKLSEKEGVGKVYLDYALMMQKLATGKGKKMMMWADIVLKHPELIPSVPKDITLLDWGYEAGYPYEKNSQTLQAAGLNFMVCPGTNSWTTITGRTDNMIATISSAAKSGTSHGAKGMLLTDWGDMGHWQYLPVSYAGYTVGAALSWNSKSENEMQPGKFLSSYIFRDEKGIMGDLVLDLGRYYRFEEFPMLNMTTSMLAFQLGLRDKVMVDAIFNKMIIGITGLMGEIAPELVEGFKETYKNRHAFDYKGLTEFLASKEKLLLECSIGTPDSALVKEEYKNAIQLIRLGSGLKEFVENNDSMTPDEQKAKLTMLHTLATNYLEVNKRLWLARNKPGGYEKSTAVLNNLISQLDNRIKLLEKAAPIRWFNRIFERAATAAAALYIKSA